MVINAQPFINYVQLNESYLKFSGRSHNSHLLLSNIVVRLIFFIQMACAKAER